MKNKVKKKLIWLDIWEIEEQESWFTDMALKGWKLTKISQSFAKFEQCQPQKLNYRVDIFKLNEKTDNNRIEFYRQAGWEHVGTRKYIQVFREIEGDEYNELHTDPLEQAETLSILKKSIYTRGILTFILSILMVMLTIAKLQINPVDNYLNDGFIEPIIMFLTYVFVSITMLKGMIHTTVLMKKLKSGLLLDHNVKYKKKKNQNKFIGISILIIISIWVITVFANLINTLQDDRFPPMPDGDLPVVQLSDFMHESQYHLIDDDPRSNYFKVDSSMFIPKQYELRQTVEVPSTMWEDNSGIYSPAIWSDGYSVRNEWLAIKFVQKLKERYSYYDGDEYELINDSEFDELWISQEDATKSEFIARMNNNVYYVVYFGMEPVEKIIDEAYKKIGSF